MVAAVMENPQHNRCGGDRISIERFSDQSLESPQPLHDHAYRK